eukprot:3767372-Alexandrium_andersonii.AAC.1
MMLTPQDLFVILPGAHPHSTSTCPLRFQRLQGAPPEPRTCVPGRQTTSKLEVSREISCALLSAIMLR